MKYLSNAFSLSMISTGEAIIKVKEVGLEEARLFAKEAKSVVGHQDTANILSGIFGFPIAFNRESIVLQRGAMLLVAQYLGGRLPEGATTLPEGAKFRYFLVSIV